MQINAKFKNLLPALSQEEFDGLERDIIAHGCLTPLVIWHTENVLLDGHNRLKICEANALKYSTQYLRFDSEEEAFNWVIDNQLGRRNLGRRKSAYLVGLRYEAEKKDIGQHEGNQYTDLEGGNSCPLKTADKIAKDSGASPRTVKNNAQYTKAVDKLGAMQPGLKDELLSDKGKITKKDAVKLAEMPKEQAINHVNRIIDGESKSLKSIALKQAKEDNLKQSAQTIKDDNRPIVYHESYKDFLKRFDSGSIDLLITDPPYSTDIDDINYFVNDWLPDALSKLNKDGRAYICIGAYPVEMQTYFNALLNQKKFILDNPIVWTYRNTLGQTPKMKYNLNYQTILHLYSESSKPLNTSITNEMFSVMDINAPDGRLGNRFFKWQKPDELANRLLRHSTKPGDKVIDCFAGSGAFLAAAAKAGCAAMGCDIDIETISKRGFNVIQK